MPLLEKYRVPRSTYNRRNALTYKYIFDRAIEEKSPIEIPQAGTSYTVLTLRQKLNDALLWLIENFIPRGGDPYTRKDYEHLKLYSKIRVKKDGILLDYRDNITIIVPRTVEKIKEKQAKWKEDLKEFLENPDKKMFFIKDLNLFPDDKKWVEATISSYAGVECSVTDTEIKIVK